MENDGYSLDDKRTKIEKSDLQDIIEKFKSHDASGENDRKAKHFFVPKAEVVENDYDLSLNTYKEEVYEEIVYDKPDVILGKLEALEDKIHSELIKVKSLFE